MHLLSISKSISISLSALLSPLETEPNRPILVSLIVYIYNYITDNHLSIFWKKKFPYSLFEF